MKDRWIFGLGFVVGVAGTYLMFLYNKKAYIAFVTDPEGGEHIVGVFSNNRTAAREGVSYGTRNYGDNYSLEVYMYNVDAPNFKRPENMQKDNSEKAVITEQDFVNFH